MQSDATPSHASAPTAAALANAPNLGHRKQKKISIVTPCYNEEAGIAECYQRVREVMEAGLATYDYEHLFIDNASADRTVAILKEIAARDRRVKIIVNARNFGHTRSPHHGMLQITGDAYVAVV